MTNQEAKILIKKTMPKGNNAIEIQLRAALEQAVSALGAIEQFRCERDVAIGQLREIGLELGLKTDEVQKAVNKQIAMKPKEVIGLYNCTYYVCPVCGNDGLSGNYCDECGQRIDID